MKRKDSESIYSPELERALAGAALLDAGVTTFNVLPEHFYLEDCGTVFRIARDLFNAGMYVDATIIFDEIERRGLDIPLSFLIGLSNDCVSVASAETYAQRVREDAHRRQSARFAERLAKTAYSSNGTYGDELATIHQQIGAHMARLRPVVAEDAEPATWADLPAILGPIEWDWPGWQPRGMLVELVASSGIGKSNLALRIGATYILRWPWPDGSEYRGELGSVLWCESEAAQKINLDRAQAWGLPLQALLSPLGDLLADVNLFDATHRAAIAAKAARPEVRLIIVDSLSGASGGREKGEDQMPVVKFLAELARDTGKSVLLLHHLRKRNQFDGVGDVVTLDQVRGATQIIQLARVVWAVDTPNPNEADHRRLAVIKNNLARFPKPIGLRIDDGGLSFDAVAPAPPLPDSPLNRAVDLLRALLASGPLPMRRVEEEADGAGVSMNAMRQAKEALNVIAIRKGGKYDAHWLWSLPAVQPSKAADS